ncbi:signal recognition particle 14 kDa protein isoform X1 [Nymphaea colorata]|nr:signal recognition particle 14 kDa protein isoform X1 [Nymphaea colorata]
MFLLRNLQVLLQPDPFLNELTSMYERNREKGSVWVTLKRSCLRPKGKRKLEIDASEYKCLVRATDGQKTISTVLSAKDHVRFQASYATVLKAHMDALKKRERKDKKKVAEADKQKASSKAT